MKQREIYKEKKDPFLKRLLPLFVVDTYLILPLHQIQLILEVWLFIIFLKFPIDYFSSDWTGTLQPLFIYLDLSYYISYVPQSLLVALLLSYTLLYLTLNVFVWVQQCAHPLLQDLRKLLLDISTTIFLLPLLNIALRQMPLTPPPLLTASPSFLQIIVLVCLSLYSIFLLIQTYFNFQFLLRKEKWVRCKRSALGRVSLLVYCYMNEVAAYIIPGTGQLLVLHVGIALVILITWIKDQTVDHRIQAVKLCLIGVNLLAILMTDCLVFLHMGFTLANFVLVAVVLLGVIAQSTPTSLRFEIENVNKWSSADIMLRYTSDLAVYLRMWQHPFYQAYLFGYGEMHRQKCSNVACPYQVAEEGVEGEYRAVKGIIQKIFDDGGMLNPISAELELAEAIFQYEQKEREKALRTLLYITNEELPFDKYYKYEHLKARLHKEMCEAAERAYLDLVSQLEMEAREKILLKLFQKVAMMNLEFWNVLNDDHPDFQKLVQLTTEAVGARRSIEKQYERLCQYAHSQKITTIYANYLQNVENEEVPLIEIYANLEEKYGLRDKIKVRDWVYSSIPTMLISFQQKSLGNILNLNTSLAIIFGYERFQLIGRPLSKIFPSGLNRQIERFNENINMKVECFFQNSNGYLLQMSRIAQYYNSIESGISLIVTFQLISHPYQCYFLINSAHKIITSTSSCQTLFAYDPRNFKQQPLFSQIFSIPLQSLSKSTSLYFQQFLRLPPIQPQNYTYKVICYPRDQFTCLKLTASLRFQEKEPLYAAPDPYTFSAEATHDEFKFIGLLNGSKQNIGHFEALFAQEQIRLDMKYGDNIKTLRLLNNIIQVIENNELTEEEIRNKLFNEKEDSIQSLAQCDEDEIFSSKETYQRFLSQNQIKNWVGYLLLMFLVVFLGTSIATYVLLRNNCESTVQMTEQIIYSNLIVGCMTKQASFLSSIDLMIAKGRDEQLQYLVKFYNANVVLLERIQENGIAPIVVNVTQGPITQQLYSDQFLRSFVNYANTINTALINVSSVAQLQTMLRTMDQAKIGYLRTNSRAVRDQMLAAVQNNQNMVQNALKVSIAQGAGLLTVGLVLGVGMAVAMICCLYRITEEYNQILSVFLDLNQVQIQQFSSKTEKFVMILQTQDNGAEQIDVQEDIENTKKRVNAMFAKKKRFKSTNQSKQIYVKIIIIPLICIVFFSQIFFKSYQNLTFMRNSITYIALTAKADYVFYSGLQSLQKSILLNTTAPDLTSSFIQFYRQYFKLHYDTFGYITDYHDYFTNVMVYNICNGSVTVVDACLLFSEAQNGTIAVFIDSTIKSNFVDKTLFLQSPYLLNYNIISNSHYLLSQQLLLVQRGIVDSVSSGLLDIFLVWLSVFTAVALLYGVPLIHHYVQAFNYSRSILLLLPLSLAKELPSLKKYINRVLQRQ